LSTPEDPAKPPPKSYGNIDEHHWTRSRKASNQEALDYYRERSHAPGVAEGGGPRNFYCMQCDGVIPTDQEGAACPHCGVSLEGVARRYFNWVEIDQPPSSDLRALLPVAAALLVVLAGLAWLLWSLFA
jgi:hypothetical protein